VGVKGIFILRLLILASILGPDDFGLFAISVVAVNFLMSLSDPGMLQALVQRDEARDTHFHAAWTVGMSRALIICLAVVLAAPLISEMFAEPRATDLLRVLALRPVVDASVSMRLATLVRELRFRSLAALRWAEALTNAFVSIALAGPMGVWALVIGPLCGSLVRAVLSYVAAPYRPRVSWQRRTLGDLFAFGRWIWLYGVIAVAGDFGLRMILSRRLGTAEVGLYFLAASLGFVPSEIASKVMGQVAFPVYSRLQHEVGRARRAFGSIFAGTALLVVPASALLAVLAPRLVGDLLGARWEASVPLIQILALVNIVGLLDEVAGPLLQGIGKPDRMAHMRTVMTICLLLLLWPMTSAFGLNGAALAWLPAVVATQLLAFVYLKGVLDRPPHGLGGQLIAMLVGTAAATGVAVLSVGLLRGAIGLGLAAALALLTYAAVIWWMDRRFRLGLVGDASRVFPELGAVTRRFSSGGDS
jgi:O-antigen/teichoic acid export membrane protein